MIKNQTGDQPTFHGVRSVAPAQERVVEKMSDEHSTNDVERLIGAMREELHVYGGMLLTLDCQHSTTAQRAGSPLHETLRALEFQTDEVRRTRNRSQSLREALCLSLKIGGQAITSEIMTRLPEDYRPLLNALMDENNELFRRVQKMTLENVLLLNHSVEAMQRMLGRLEDTGDSQELGTQLTLSVKSGNGP